MQVARLRWLLARGARLELKDWTGRTALHWASQEGRAETARELLLQGSALEAATFAAVAGRQSPLLIASREGHLEIVRELRSRRGSTPLFAAIKQGHLEVVRELLTRGAAVDSADKGGRTPLHIASEWGHAQVVRELLARGAAVDAANEDGWTPLHGASVKATWRLSGSCLRGAPR